MHQTHPTANGAAMTHQQYQYNTVPPAQQQQQGGGPPNHSQQQPGAVPPRHQPYQAYAAQTGQQRAQQHGGGPPPNQQVPTRILQFAQHPGNPAPGHTPQYISQPAQGQQAHHPGMHPVAQIPGQPRATLIYAPGPQPIQMTIHSSPHISMFQQTGPRQQVPAQPFYHHTPQQMALQGHHAHPALAAAAASGQNQPQQHQVLYNYPPQLYGQGSPFQQHITPPMPMMPGPGQPGQPQIASMHPTQPPPTQVSQTGQQGQLVQTQVSAGGGQPPMPQQQQMQQTSSTHPAGAPQQQGQQPSTAQAVHHAQGGPRPQPTQTPPHLIQQGAPTTNQGPHPVVPSSVAQSHTGVMNPVGPPPPVLPVHPQPLQHVPQGVYQHKPRQRKGISIINPETGKEIVYNKPGSISTATETNAQKEVIAPVDKNTVDTPVLPTKEPTDGKAASVVEAKQKSEQIRAEFQSKVIQAKAKETESDGTINKKAHELVVNAGQGDVSSKEKLTAQSTEATKLPDNEIHSETLQLEPLNDGATSSTPESAEGAKVPSRIIENPGNRTTIKTVSDSVSSSNASSKRKVEPEIKPDNLPDKNEKLLEADSKMLGEEKLPSSNIKSTNSSSTTNIAKATPNTVVPAKQDSNVVRISDPISTSPKRSKDEKLVYEAISPTPLPELGASNGKLQGNEVQQNTAPPPTLPSTSTPSNFPKTTVTTAATLTETANDQMNKGVHKISGKAKRDEINKRAGGTDMDVFTDTNSISESTLSSTVDPSSAQSTALHGDNSNPSIVETIFSVEPKIINETEQILVSEPSTQVAQELNSKNGSNQLSTLAKDETHDTAQISLGQELVPEQQRTTSQSPKINNTSSPLAIDTTSLNSNYTESEDMLEEPDLSVTAASAEHEAVIVENGVAEKTNVQLKYDYKPDQWSPINVEGKKQYDREFLIKLQQDPLSMTKPENLPNMDIIKDRAIAKISSVNLGANKGPGDMFTPSFVKPTLSNRGPPPRNSRDKKLRQGQQSTGPNPMVIKIPCIQEKVDLHQSDNAWKPKKLIVNEEENVAVEDEGAILIRKVKAILNKLTPQKFDTLVGQFKELEIDDESKLQMCMELVFEKAVDEPGFSVAYAKMCEVLKNKEVKSSETGKPVNFKKLLITMCQKEFYRDYMEGLDQSQYDADMAAADSDEKRKHIQEDFEAKERRARRRSLGNIRFIGELYKLKMLTARIMHECVQRLLRAPPSETDIVEAREESLECLCKLLTTVGKDLENETTSKLNDTTKGSQTKANDLYPLDAYFTEMQNIINGKQTSARVRFMLQDLTDLRRNRWIPRRESDGPKTIDKIHAEVAREKTMQQLHDHNVGGMGGMASREGSKTLGRDRDGRGAAVGQDGRKRSSRGPPGQGGVDEQGWTTMPTRAPTKVQEKFDPKQLSGIGIMGKKDPESMSLGMPSSMRPTFMGWGKGSGGGRLSQPKEDLRDTHISKNIYASLSNQAAERSVSPSGQQGILLERQGSPGSQSPFSTLDRQNRAGSGGSRSTGGPHMAGVRDYRSTSRGPMESNNERQSAVNAAREMQMGSSIGSCPNFGKMPSNGPPGIPVISRKPSDPTLLRTPLPPSEDEIRLHQQKMMKLGDEKVKKFGDNQEDLDRCITNFLDEHLHTSCDDKELETNICESFNSDVMPRCVELWVNRVMDRKDPKHRLMLANLLSTLVKKCLLQKTQCVKGLGKFLQSAIDLICDIPKIWDYLGEIIAPMLDNEVFPMKCLIDTAREIYPDGPCKEKGQYIEAVLRNLSITRGKQHVGEMWREANLDWGLFLQHSDIDTFIKQNKLEYTLNTSNDFVQSGISPEQIERDLKQRLQISQPTQNEEIHKWINNYIKAQPNGEPDSSFIRILTTVVIESTISGMGVDQPYKCTLNQEDMQQRASLLKRVLDAKVDRETQALYAIQALIHRLEHPNKLLHQIFECLYQADVITSEGFEAWETSTDPAEQEGKGVAIKSTTQFFTWLKEADQEEDQ